MSKTKWHSEVIHLVVVVALALVLSFSLVTDAPVIADASYEEFADARSAANVTSIEVVKPGDTVEGNLLIGVVITDGDTSGEFTGPTGWTLINEGWSGQGDFPGCTLGAWYLIAGYSEPTTYAWNWTSAETVYAFIIRITGHDTDDPIDVWDFATGVNDMSPTCPDVTTTAADTLVLRIFGYDSCYGWNATYPDDHSGITVESSRPGCEPGDEGHCSGGAAYTTQAAAGDTGMAAFQVTDGQSFWAWRTLTIAVRPAPVQYDLTISSTAGGNVTTPGEGTSTHDEGTVVDLVAEADECYEFVNWTGDVGTIADVYAAATNIIMEGDYSITANFTPIDCDYLDGWVEDGSPYTACNGTNVCTYQDMVYLDYECVGGVCVSTETDWRTDLIGCESCDDGIACTIDECQGGVCTHTPDDSLCPADGWVDTGNTQWVEDTPCTEKEQKEQEYRDYYCDEFIGCTHNVTGTQWVDTGNTQNKADGTPCTDDGDPYTIDTCVNGTCVHIAAYDLTMAANPEIGGTATDLTNVSPYAEGTEVSIKAEANEGYEFVNWTAPAGVFGNATAEETVFTMPTQNVTVTANFELEPVPTTLVLLPATGSNHVDTTHNLTATVYDQFNNVMAGVDVTWNITGVGSFSGTPESPTDVNGEADAVITSSVPGTSTVTCEVTGSPSVSDNATKDWTWEVPPTPVYPTVTTLDATGIGLHSAILNMNYTVGDFNNMNYILGDFSPVEVCFACKDVKCQIPGSPWPVTDWVSKELDGTYAALVTGLDPKTTYEFKAQLKYDDNGTVIIEGATLYFTTDKSSLPPSEGCFIATAAYGTPTAEQIDVLREFRDVVLLESTVGSQFVALYYQLSPPVADFISGSSVLRTLVREFLVDPIVWVVEATGDIWQN